MCSTCWSLGSCGVLKEGRSPATLDGSLTNLEAASLCQIVCSSNSYRRHARCSSCAKIRPTRREVNESGHNCATQSEITDY